MSEEKLGIASVPIRAELDQLDKDLDKANSTIEDKLLAGIKSAGGKIASVGSKLIAGGIGVATGALAALGAAGWKAANDLDGVYDTIQIGTGAAGDELDGLKSDFDAVFKTVPADADALGGTIAKLNSALGVSGETLQGLAGPLVRVSDMMGGDAANNAELLAQAMNNWGVPAEHGAGLLDKLFVASQSTGAGLEGLMTSITANGASLRQMGFDMDESIALMAGLEQAGVNSGEVMAAMKRSAAGFAEAGIPLNEGLAQTIEAIKGAGSESEALNLAMDVFGTRAGPAMVAAIQEGRLELGGLVESMAGADGAIMTTAAATDDWGQKLDLLKQRAMLALNPLGEQMMALAGTALDQVGPALDQLAGWVTDKVVPAIGPLSEGIGFVVDGLGKLRSGDVAGFLGSLESGFYKIGEALGISKEKLDPVIEGFRSVTETIQTQVLPVVDSVVGFVGENLTPILAGLAAALLAVVVPAFVTWAGAAVTAAAGTMAALAPVIAPIVAIGAAVALLVKAWENDWGGIRTTLTTFWETTGRPIFETVKDWLQTQLPEAIAQMQAWFGEKWDAITSKFDEAKEKITGTATAVKTWFSETLPGAAEEMRSKITEKASTVANAFKTKFTSTMDELNPRWREDWEAVKKAASDKMEQAKQNLSTKLDETKTKIGGFLTETKRDWSEKWEEIRSDLAQFGTKLIAAAGEAMQPLLNWISERLADLRNLFTSIDWSGIGNAIIQGISGGVMNAAGGLAEAAANAARAALDAAKRFLGIGSPSKRARLELGRPIPEGMALGVEDATPALGQAIADMARAGMADAAGNLSSLAGLPHALAALARPGAPSLPTLGIGAGASAGAGSIVNWEVHAHYAEIQSETTVRDTIRALQLAGA